MSFRRYEAYKDSGVEWLGEVPRGWTVCALAYRYDVQLGKMLDKKRITGERLAPYLRNVDVQWGRIDVVDLPEMDFHDDDVVRFSLKANDLLVCEGGEVGRAALWSGEVAGCFYQKALHRLRPIRGQADSPKLAFYLMFAAAKLGVFSGSEGKATIVHLPAETLRRHRFAFPPLGEQVAIAAFLDRETAKIDALVEEQQRLIALLKEKRQAVISHAVTKGLDPNVPMRDSGVEWLGEVPAHWEVARLKRACSLLKDGTHLPPSRVEQGVPLLSVRNVEEGRFALRDDDLMISEDDFAELSRSFVPEPDDVLLAIVGATLGKTAIVPDDLGPFHIQRSLAVFRLGPSASPTWLYFVFRSEGFQRLLWENVGYSAQPGIYLGALGAFHIPVPPRVEQDKIIRLLAEQICRLDLLIDEAVLGITLLQERRSALISAAVTGKIDVRGLVPAEAEAA